MRTLRDRFKRVTESTQYLPEIDGLRFVAIFLVVAVMHSLNYINVMLNEKKVFNLYWKNQILEAGFGVALFYIISGFILSQPFLKQYQKKGKEVNIRHYYLRRLTRLEPPYFIALIIFFIAYVYVLHQYSFRELFPNLVVSALYLNGPLYQTKSTILPVAWSLEVEVQFYLLAPLFFQSFRIRSPYIRRGLYLLIIILGTLFWHQKAFPFVFNLLHFFFAGILLCDLYYNQVALIKNRHLGLIVGIASGLGIFFIPAIDNPAGVALKLICMFLFAYLVLTNVLLKSFFAWKWIPVIGGMCYSIYLLHFGVVSIFGKWWLHCFGPTTNTLVSLLFYLFLLTAILFVSALYFLIIEKPFMKSLDFRKAFKRKILPVTNT